LPYKGGEFVMLEIFGKDLFRELVFVLDDETIPFICPINNITILTILAYKRGILPKCGMFS
jgi:hypothetical protein